MSSSDSSSDSNTVTVGREDWLHFVGVAGSGMSALAQFHALGGGRVTGSDRAFDRGQQPAMRVALEKLGVRIVPQDGGFATGTRDGRACTAVIASTAIEAKIPDLEAAAAAGLPGLHRSELLARFVAAHRTIAITGTSGKSTVTAMVFTILREAGLEPGLLTGGALAELTAAGHIGNAWAPGDPGDGEAPWLVIEADESDGSLVRYAPHVGAVLNLGLDHKEPAVVLEMFRTFAANTAGAFLVGAAPELVELRRDGFVFGVSGEGESDFFAQDIELKPDSSKFRIADVEFDLPAPGLYNVLNAAAAVALGSRANVPPATAARALADFGGVSRRFQSLGTAGGVEVIDDFAHNPDKIAAALAAARGRVAGSQQPQGRILAVFQPHGFGPTRFLRTALVKTFVGELRADDELWLPEIFFAGGTVQKDISAADLVADVRGGGRRAHFCASRADIPAELAAAARPGDLVLVMGARDPSLTAFGAVILELLAGN